MSLLRGVGPLTQAAAEGRALGGFVVYNMETAQGIVKAAETTGLPMILQAGSSAFGFAGTETLANLCIGLAQGSTAAVGVHLDHCRSLEEIDLCLRLGYTSVMVDGSHLPYGENVALTREVVGRARDTDVWVEAELVAIAGEEDVSTDATAGLMTDPVRAGEFVRATGAHALAVSVGNVHGFTPIEPVIDYPRLEDIRERTGVPLVLHGASGLSNRVLQACVARGVAKVNFNTELRRAFLEAFAEALPTARAKTDLVGPLDAARHAVAHVAGSIAVFLHESRPIDT